MQHKDSGELIRLLSIKRTPEEWRQLLQDLFTERERASFAERWSILRMLHAGTPQRDIAETLGVSISKITKGSKVLQQGGKGVMKALEAGVKGK